MPSQLAEVVNSSDKVSRFWIALFGFAFVCGGIVTQTAVSQARMQEDLAALQNTAQILTIGLAQTSTQTQAYQLYARERQAATDANIQAMLAKINEIDKP